MNDSIFTPAFVDGMEFAFKWHDFGSFLRLDVFKDGKLLGSKKYPIKTDRDGVGIVTYSIRSLLRAKQNDKTH